MMRYLFVVGVVLGTVVPSLAQPTVRVTQDIDKTAVFAGERFVYSVLLTVPPGAHLAVEDFQAKNVNFSPFVVNGVTPHTETLSDGTVKHRFDYSLSSYETGDKPVELQRIVFRYQPVGETGAARAATAEMAVPAIPVAVRSTLNQPLADSWIRESLPVGALPDVPWLLVGIGVVGLLVSSLPLWFGLRTQLAAWNERRGRPSRRQFLEQWRRSLERIEADTTTDIKTRFHTLEALALQYTHELWEVPATGFTPEDLRRKLEELQVDPVTREVLAEALDQAQQCRYSPPDAVGWEENLRRGVVGLRTLAA